MFELIKLGEKTFYLKNISNIGIYLLNDKDICLIDTGNDEECGKKISKIIEENNWNLKYIINTHSHADHIGGNNYLQKKYKCEIYCSRIENHFINDTILEPGMLYGSIPLEDLKNKFIMADNSISYDINKTNIKGIEIVDLKGHSVEMIGVLTSDNVLFTGDAFTSEKIINKYAIQYIYDIDNYLDTLNNLKDFKCNYFVPSHGEVLSDINDVLSINIEVTKKIEDNLLIILNNPKTLEEILKEIFDCYHINMNIIQYFLIGTTIKAYIAKLKKENKITFSFIDNKMIIKKL